MNDQKHATKSMTMIGMVVVAALFAIDRFQLNVSESEVRDVVELIAGIVGIAMTVYGRWRKGDLYLRKPQTQDGE